MLLTYVCFKHSEVFKIFALRWTRLGCFCQVKLCWCLNLFIELIYSMLCYILPHHDNIPAPDWNAIATGQYDICPTTIHKIFCMTYTLSWYVWPRHINSRPDHHSMRKYYTHLQTVGINIFYENTKGRSDRYCFNALRIIYSFAFTWFVTKENWGRRTDYFICHQNT